MKIFCHKCGTQAIDDKSSFCNNCGTQLIPYPTKKNADCPNCGNKIINRESVFCSQCGSPISPNNFEVTTVPASIGVKTYALEAKQSKPQKPLKRTSMILPAILFFIAFVIVILIISSIGVLDPISSLRSLTTSQEHMFVPANGTPIPTSPVTTGAPTTHTTMTNAPVISTQTPTPIQHVPTVTPATQAAMKDIVETVEADGRFTTLVAAMKAAELDGTLSGDTLSGPEFFTVFAPTDDAFKKLSAGSMDTLLRTPKGLCCRSCSTMWFEEK